MKPEWFLLFLFGATPCVVAIVAVGLYDFSLLSADTLDLADYGVIGDYFGGILNPIFAGFSFLALMVTVVFQLSELRAQREEMALTREELRRSQEAQTEMAKQQSLQNQLQFHTARTQALSTLVSVTTFEAQSSCTEQERKDALEELAVYSRKLESELEALAATSREGVEQLRKAEVGLFGFSDL